MAPQFNILISHNMNEHTNVKLSKESGRERGRKRGTGVV